MTVDPGGTEVPAAGVLSKTRPTRGPSAAGTNPTASRAAMAWATVSPSTGGTVTGCGPSETLMATVEPSRAVPVGVQEMT